MVFLGNGSFCFGDSFDGVNTHPPSIADEPCAIQLTQNSVITNSRFANCTNLKRF